MTPLVFAAVLFGAALHASWNAIVKGGADKLLTTILVAAASGLVAIVGPALPATARARRAGPSSPPRRSSRSSTSRSSPAPTAPPT